MGFFSDLKDDLSQAVNELIPEEEQVEEREDVQEPEVSLEKMLENIDDVSFPEELADDDMETLDGQAIKEAVTVSVDDWEQTPEPQESAWRNQEPVAQQEPAAQQEFADRREPAGQQEPVNKQEPDVFGQAETPEPDGLFDENAENAAGQELQEESVDEDILAAEYGQVGLGNAESEVAERKMDVNTNRAASDEISIITEGMVITGDLVSEGSVDLIGTVNGNIDARGKLNITGHINGNSKAAEIYAESAKVNGEVVSEGAVKIGASSIVIGNITATSAAIAGAVKGDIDVRGPVVLDASAIVMGNIKSKSVQINNGAVIEGMCSQCYAEVNPTSFFDEYQPEKRKAKSR